MPPSNDNAVYPVEYGFKVSVRIERGPEIVFVSVLSPLYVNKEWLMPHQYSTEFSDAEILRDVDFLRVLRTRFGDSLPNGDCAFVFA